MHKEKIPIPPPPENHNTPENRNTKKIELYEYYDFNVFLKKIIDSEDLILHNSFSKRDKMSIIKICVDMGKIYITFIYSKIYPKKDTLHRYVSSGSNNETIDLYQMLLEKEGFSVSIGRWEFDDIKILDNFLNKKQE